MSETTTEASGVPRRDREATGGDGGRTLRARRGPGGVWKQDEVAAHLMGCQRQMVRGLARKSPWAGLDDDTLASCFGHGAAVITRVAASGQRPEWRTTKDLEKAQIAAFRHQALDHWKRVNAQSREGDRFTVAFDPERHAADHTPLDRLFEQPDLFTIQRDLLAELTDLPLRAFWARVLNDGAGFKDAGDALGLPKSGVMAATRAGRAAFADYLDRRSSGRLCVERSFDITARRMGRASELQEERAAAHLEACYACALVHEPQTSALRRGILGVAPTTLILRLATRASELAASPAARLADAAPGARTAAAGIAAIAVAGSAVGIEQIKHEPPERVSPRTAIKTPRATPISARTVTQATPAVTRQRTRTPKAAAQPQQAKAKAKAVARTHAIKPAKTSHTAPRRVAVAKPPQSSAPAQQEFGFEQGGTAAPSQPPAAAPAPAPAPRPAAPSSSSPAANEFPTP